MTENPIRAEVVSLLIAGAWVDAGTLEPTSAAFAVAGDALADLAKDELRGSRAPETGALAARPDHDAAARLRSGVRDLGARHTASRARHRPDHRAGLKVLSPAFARRVSSILVSAGLLDPDDTAGDQ